MGNRRQYFQERAARSRVLKTSEKAPSVEVRGWGCRHPPGRGLGTPGRRLAGAAREGFGVVGVAQVGDRRQLIGLGD